MRSLFVRVTEGIEKERVLILIFVAFLIMRVFISSDNIIIGPDNSKYLALANSFPEHKLYYDSYFFMHPPMYPYAVSFFMLLFPDYIAAMTVSLVSSIVVFLITVKLFRLLGIEDRVLYLSLFIVAINAISIDLSHVSMKESFFLALFYTTLYFFASGLKSGGSRAFLFSTIPASMAAITSDSFIFLPPAILSFFIVLRKGKRIDLKPILTLTIPILIYLSLVLVPRIRRNIGILCPSPTT